MKLEITLAALITVLALMLEISNYHIYSSFVLCVSAVWFFIGVQVGIKPANYRYWNWISGGFSCRDYEEIELYDYLVRDPSGYLTLYSEEFFKESFRVLP